MHGSVVFARWRKCAPHTRKPRNGCHGNVLRYRVSAISASVGQRLKPPSVANCLVPIVYTKQLIAILVPKLVAMATSLSTAGPPSNAWFLRPSEPKTQTASRSVQSLSPLSNRKIAQYHGGIRTPSNTWFLGPPESSTQMASRSVQPFLQGSLVWQTDRPRYLVGNNRPHLRT